MRAVALLLGAFLLSACEPPIPVHPRARGAASPPTAQASPTPRRSEPIRPSSDLSRQARLLDQLARVEAALAKMRERRGDGAVGPAEEKLRSEAGRIRRELDAPPAASSPAAADPSPAPR